MDSGLKSVCDSHTSESRCESKAYCGYYWHFWTLDDISEAFQKALIWLGGLRFEIRVPSVCDSHARLSHFLHFLSSHWQFWGSQVPGIDRFEEMCVISASGSPVISQTESSPTFPVQNSSEADADPVALMVWRVASQAPGFGFGGLIPRLRSILSCCAIRISSNLRRQPDKYFRPSVNMAICLSKKKTLYMQLMCRLANP